MRGLLQGVVRDHRLPCDYKAPSVQPSNSGVFWRNFKRHFMVRMMNKNHVHFPISYFFFFIVPLFFAQSHFRMKVTGSYPQLLQP